MYNKDKPYNELPFLSAIEINNVPELTRLAEDARVSIEILNYVIKSFPFPEILSNIVLEMESIFNARIDGIVVTDDDLFQYKIYNKYTPALSKVDGCKYGIKKAFYLLQDKRGLSCSDIIDINNEVIIEQQDIRNNIEGFSNSIYKIQGESEYGDLQTVYSPPEGKLLITDLLIDMLDYVFDDENHTYHPLIKIALAHYQFESIHPFKEGNGRTGRILNTLFMCNKGYLGMPILYASSHLLKNKKKYFKLLRDTHQSEDYYEFIKFMLDSFKQTAITTRHFIERLCKLLEEYKAERFMKNFRIEEKSVNAFLELLIGQQYLKISDLKGDEIGLHRQTASLYLDMLTDMGCLSKVKVGRENIYKNIKLFELFEEVNNG